MNWFTKEYFNNAKGDFVQEGDLCPHLEELPDQKTFTTTENDSFGVVGRYSCCNECNDQMLQDEREEEHQCYDCSGDFSLNNGTLWKSYDFYPDQGDEALFICNDCRTLPAHLSRIRVDSEHYEQERAHQQALENEENYLEEFEDVE